MPPELRDIHSTNCDFNTEKGDIPPEFRDSSFSPRLWNAIFQSPKRIKRIKIRNVVRIINQLSEALFIIGSNLAQTCINASLRSSR